MSGLDGQTAPVTGARRYAMGAELLTPSLVSVRVWAPSHADVRVVIDGTPHTLLPDEGGYFQGEFPARAGSRYGFQLGRDATLYADPASRFQPDGPHGLSEVVDAGSYQWRDHAWRGLTLRDQVIYELHIGTFTAEGTWQAAAADLPRLRDIGITVVQMMPVSDFPGEFGWGYDGVNWFAPSRLYGEPDDLRRFVDHAHGLGLGVILDVVYNHLGPSGNYLAQFSPDYFTDRHANEWGSALNFDGHRSDGMRQLVITNAEYWVREFHVDGLRLDATHAIVDDSAEHVLAALGRRARQAAAPRQIIIIAESEPQDPTLIRPLDAGGYGLDGIYSEDFHHTTRVALTGQREAYYTDYTGSSEELLAAARWGLLYQGQYFSWQSLWRGSLALDRPLEQFVAFLENHDQVANSSTGDRLVDLAAPGALRALTALMLLGPTTPLLFQGQEYGSRQPFLFFADHDEPLTALIRAGREQFLSQFSRCVTAQAGAGRSIGREAFEASKLRRDDGRHERAWSTLHRDLIRLRREDRVFANRSKPPEGATLGPRAVLLRDLTPSGDDRLLIVNLGPDFDLARAPHPFAAPPAGHAWHALWTSESAQYGGAGAPAWDADRWLVPGLSAMVLATQPISPSVRSAPGGPASPRADAGTSRAR